MLFTMLPVAPDSNGREMQEMNDRTRAANECRCEDGGDGEKECDFGEKIPPRLGAEIFAADVEERRP